MLCHATAASDAPKHIRVVLYGRHEFDVRTAQPQFLGQEIQLQMALRQMRVSSSSGTYQGQTRIS